eukprot:TRINITY_DN22260_c0_g3_i2.p1 TRINITY_DN22260_c0_g3~~TRINITY_DN22260_c0_g3_i2.p1  ORF type:complete len:105 (-),score=6.60 TRINITY_DN22260_c0_g3_i2:190-504(-)
MFLVTTLVTTLYNKKDDVFRLVMLGSHYGNRPGNSPNFLSGNRNLHRENSHYPLQQTALPLSDIPARVAKPVSFHLSLQKLFGNTGREETRALTLLSFHIVSKV